jgi:hypothetical protein
MEISMSAIISDMASEIEHFATCGWRRGVSVKKLRRRLNTLREIGRFPFDSIAKIGVI